MKIFALPALFFLIPIVAWDACLAQNGAFGIDTRHANTSLIIADLPPSEPGAMQIEKVFPQLYFSQPVLLIEIPDGSNRLAVVEKLGRVRVFPNTTDPAPGDASVLLDISEKVVAYGEQGLLGLAFDPDYGQNGEFYVYYTWNGTSPGTSTVSRFTNANPAGFAVDPATEEILLQVPQPYSNHNAGMIAFGPDDMLYVALGDGGSGGDPLDSGQDLSTLLGCILRLDVRSAPQLPLPYRIPGDNPFVDGGPEGSTARPEIFAYGLRNPWRFSFDRINGFLLAGDVGQGAREEIDHIRSGENYGWRIMEGSLCFKPATGCDQTGLTLPLFDYGRDQGNSVTGGYVYSGSQVPDLYGLYIFGDYGSGRIWGLYYEGAAVQGPYVLVANSGLNISSFGQDESGEVYILDIFGGGIYAIRPVSAGGDFPTRLSALPALLAAGSGIDQTNDGIIPYAPGAKLWSDGTLKERYIALPDLDTMGYREDAGWDFPENSAVIKNFVMPLDERDPGGPSVRLETRLLFRKDSQWHGFSYEWNDEQTDANLLWTSKTKTVSITDGNGEPVSFEYLYPSRSQCVQCHTNAANGALGLNTAQMNVDFEYPASGIADNQLRTYDHISLFSQPLPDIPDNLPRMPDYLDPSAALHDRARAYLAANCSMCHRPGAPAPTALDLRWGIAEEQMNAIDVSPGNGDLGIEDAKIVSTTSVDQSVLLHRIGLRDKLYQMPPLGTSRVDTDGYSLLSDWVLGFQGPGVETSGATDETKTSAVLHGVLNPRGFATDYHFEYWYDQGPVQSTPVATSGAQVSDTLVAETVTGLLPDILYSFRLAAENARGPATGAAKTFTTRILYVQWQALPGGCGGATPCYPSINDALLDLETGATAVLWTDQQTFVENATFDNEQTLTLRGGWNSNFSAVQDRTTVEGALAIDSGTVQIENLTIR